MQLRFYQINSFTRERFKGNPACVVPDANGLSSLQMQEIAREMNVSETAFILPDASEPDEIHVRFFTPTTEVPVCGHATIAAHYVLALEGRMEGVVRQRSLAGLLPVETNVDPAGSVTIWMHQKPAEFEMPMAEDVVERLLTALNISKSDLQSGLPIQVVSTGHSKVIVPLHDRQTLSDLKPDFEALARLSDTIGCNGYYPFTLDATDGGELSHGRMFAPAIGINEDPVTGNASGCLGAYLLRHRLVSSDAAGVVSFIAGQGREVGRPGRVYVEAMQIEADGPISVRVGGHAVVAFRGSLEPD